MTAAVILLTRVEAADLLKISPEQLADHVRDGELSYINVGRGLKRPRMRFTEADLAEFIERRRKRRGVACPSTSPRNRLSTASTSSSKVIGFMAQRAARHDAKRKPSSAGTGSAPSSA
jgi:Helix-turn-helix domain